MFLREFCCLARGNAGKRRLVIDVDKRAGGTSGSDLAFPLIALGLIMRFGVPLRVCPHPYQSVACQWTPIFAGLGDMESQPSPRLRRVPKLWIYPDKGAGDRHRRARPSRLGSRSVEPPTGSPECSWNRAGASRRVKFQQRSEIFQSSSDQNILLTVPAPAFSKIMTVCIRIFIRPIGGNMPIRLHQDICSTAGFHSRAKRPFIRDPSNMER